MAAGFRRIGFAVIAVLAAYGLRPAYAADTIKVAYIDPFSGPFASGGDEFPGPIDLRVHSPVVSNPQHPPGFPRRGIHRHRLPVIHSHGLLTKDITPPRAMPR